MTIGTRAITHRANAPRLCAYWFGIQLVWGAVLGISLQARCAQLSGHAALATYGLASVAGALAAAIVQLLVGPWSDAQRRSGGNRTAFYVAGALVSAVAIVAFFSVSNASSLVAAFVALQVGMNVATGPYQAILPDTVEHGELGRASGWMAAMQSGGNAAGAIVATILGTRILTGVAIGTVLLGTCALTVLHVRSIGLQPVRHARGFVLSRTLVDLFISRALVYTGFYTLLGYLYFYVRNALPAHAGIDATTASGIAILAFTFVGAAGAAIAAKPADRLDERAVVTIGGGIVAAGVFALAAVPAFAILPPAILAAGIGWGVFLCADWAFACRLLPPHALATTMGLWNLAIVGPQMVAPLVATFVLQRSGMLTTASGPHVAFALAGVELFAGAVWVWRLPGRSLGN